MATKLDGNCVRFFILLLVFWSASLCIVMVFYNPEIEVALKWLEDANCKRLACVRGKVCINWKCAFEYNSTFYGGNAYLQAAARGDIDALESLAATNIDTKAIDSNGYTALLLASVYANLATVKWLLNHGSKIDETGKDGYGLSLIHI